MAGLLSYITTEAARKLRDKIGPNAVSILQSQQPGYVAATEQKPIAQDLLNKPASLPKITDSDAYKAASQKINIRSMPEYSSATQKTTLDPQYYENLWKNSQTDIEQSYFRPGSGYYDKMQGSLNERGLANAGEANFQTREMSNDLARNLAQAKAELEAQRMSTQANLDESYAGRMGNLLNLGVGVDENYANRMGNFANLISGENQFSTQMDYGYNRDVASLAQQLASARNELITRDYDRASQAAQAQYGAESDRYNFVSDILGNAELEPYYRDTILQTLGYSPNDFAQSDYDGLNIGINNMNSFAGGLQAEPKLNEIRVDSSGTRYVWNGFNWNKLGL